MPLSRTAQRLPFPHDSFADVLTANAEYATTFEQGELSGKAAQGLAIVTCIDSRIEPLAIVGMHPGDVKIIRNAGARVTDDVLRTLVLATHLLSVRRVLVMPHTRCRMAGGTEAEIHAEILRLSGKDTRSMEMRTVTDQESALVTDVVRIRAMNLLPDGIVVGGAMYDVGTGVLHPIDV